MTANPNWPEIKDALFPGQSANERPDLVARVFHAKLTSLIKEIRRCYHLSKWINCSFPRTAAHATSSGVVSHMTCASSITYAFAKALVAFPLLNPHIHLGQSSRMIGIVS